MIPESTINKCRQIIDECDALLIGAGSGLSTAAGLKYSGKRFTDNFADFIEKYHLTDMYSSAFYNFGTLEETWAYFSRHIYINRYKAEVGEPYKQLLELVKNKKHFVITTNADAQFMKAGFDQNRLFATQGDYAKFQCEKACHDKLYDNETIIKRMVEEQRNFKIPPDLIPICPVCGGYLVAHLRKDDYFVENEEWHKASSRYQQFLLENKNKKLVMLELGIGFNTPVIIRWPFEQLTKQYPKSQLIRVNLDNIQPYLEIDPKSILIKDDIAEFISGLTP